MEREGIVWENMDRVRVAENRVLLEPVDKAVMELLGKIRVGGDVGMT